MLFGEMADYRTGVENIQHKPECEEIFKKNHSVNMPMGSRDQL